MSNMISRMAEERKLNKWKHKYQDSSEHIALIAHCNERLTELEVENRKASLRFSIFYAVLVFVDTIFFLQINDANMLASVLNGFSLLAAIFFIAKDIRDFYEPIILE